MLLLFICYFFFHLFSPTPCHCECKDFFFLIYTSTPCFTFHAIRKNLIRFVFKLDSYSSRSHYADLIPVIYYYMIIICNKPYLFGFYFKVHKYYALFITILVQLVYFNKNPRKNENARGAIKPFLPYCDSSEILFIIEDSRQSNSL